MWSSVLLLKISLHSLQFFCVTLSKIRLVSSVLVDKAFKIKTSIQHPSCTYLKVMVTNIGKLYFCMPSQIFMHCFYFYMYVFFLICF